MARVLHTSDWHVGKAMRGRSRADEHRAVLTEIAGIAEAEEVDVIAVAGDLFETAAPSPEAEQIVYRALLDLAATGATVVVVAGNHDNPGRLRAVAPLLESNQVHVLSGATRPDAGGVRTLDLRSGERLGLALLPFVSQRGIVRVDALMDDAAYEHKQAYSDRLGRLVALLCAALPSDVPTLMVAHAFVQGGAAGGGERRAHLIDEYSLSSQAFPPTVGYVALGHLHRAQAIAGATAIRYSGSPLQLDFGETADVKQVTIVDLDHGVPARVRDVPLAAGSPLVTLAGPIDAIVAAAEGVDPESWIRARVDEPRRIGLADELRAALGELGDRVVDVVVEQAAATSASRRTSREGRAPRELFADFLAERAEADQRLLPLFDELLADEIETTETTEQVGR
jgi:exonuclease SbcD